MAAANDDTVDSVYDAIRQHGPCRQRQLADITGYSTATVSLCVRELRERGEIETRPMPGDARANLVIHRGEKA